MAEPRFGALSALKRQQESAKTAEPDVAQQLRQTGPQAVPEEGRRGPGRPPGGKRNNPDYERMNLLVRKDTRRKVDMKMLQDGKPEGLSELVDRLLREWAG